METAEPFDVALWRKGAALGWTAMLVPTAYEGGSVTAQPMVDLVVLAEELGRALNPGPFVPTNVVADTIARFGSEQQVMRHLPGLARGEVTAAWCLSGDGSPDPGAVELHARPDKHGWRLDGVSRYVHGAHEAGLLLVVAWDPMARPARSSWRGRRAGLRERTIAGLDLTRRFAEVHFDAVAVPENGALVGRGPAPAEGSTVVTRCLALATVLQAAESVGAAEVVFEETVEYANRRVQFGRTIGSFQAIKHRLADLYMEVEAMRVAAEYAALALGDDMDDAAEAVATAGAFVDDAFAHLCGEALQLHGGIGFTWEHDMHLFSRRAKVNQVLYGDGAWHRDQLVRLSEVGLATKAGV